LSLIAKFTLTLSFEIFFSSFLSSPARVTTERTGRRVDAGAADNCPARQNCERLEPRAAGAWSARVAADIVARLWGECEVRKERGARECLACEGVSRVCARVSFWPAATT
jgi:hypothetical protein